jgi:hypothetical protein
MGGWYWKEPWRKRMWECAQSYNELQYCVNLMNVTQ